MEFGNPIIGLEELIRNAIKSKDYAAGVTGWRIGRDGTAEFSTITIRGLGNGNILVAGPENGPQVRVYVSGNAGVLDFPTNSRVEKGQPWILSASVRPGAVNEYLTLQINGPSTTGVTAQDRIQMQLNSQNADGSSRANWQLRNNSGPIITADQDRVDFTKPTSSPNFADQPWTPFVPTWTTSTGNNLPSYGNATTNCAYYRTGRLITARYEIVFGSTTVFGGPTPNTGDNWRFSLPVQPAVTTQIAGSAYLGQSGSARLGGRVRITNTSGPGWMEIETATGRVDGAAVTLLSLIDQTSPWTWTASTGNNIYALLQYEALGSY